MGNKDGDGNREERATLRNDLYNCGDAGLSSVGSAGQLDTLGLRRVG